MKPLLALVLASCAATTSLPSPAPMVVEAPPEVMREISRVDPAPLPDPRFNGDSHICGQRRALYAIEPTQKRADWIAEHCRPRE